MKTGIFFYVSKCCKKTDDDEFWAISCRLWKGTVWKMKWLLLKFSTDLCQKIHSSLPIQVNWREMIVVHVGYRGIQRSILYILPWINLVQATTTYNSLHVRLDCLATSYQWHASLPLHSKYLSSKKSWCCPSYSIYSMMYDSCTLDSFLSTGKSELPPHAHKPLPSPEKTFSFYSLHTVLYLGSWNISAHSILGLLLKASVHDCLSSY